jgi:hypothetical protein
MEYRSYIPGDDDEAVLDLRAAVWGAEHPHNNPRFLHWLFADNPAGSGSGILMEDRGKLLGFAAILPRCVEIGGVVRTAAQCVDYMVHPGARATAGAFRIMAEWQRRARDLGFEFGMGFPNANSYRVVTSRKLGWNDACRPDLMVRPFSGVAPSRSVAPKVSRGLVRLVTGVAGKACATRAAWALRARPDGRPFLIERFDVRFDLLWQQTFAGLGPGIRRDANYLNWRYVRHPTYTYMRVGWESDGELSGYAVATVREIQGMRCVLLVDLAARAAARNVAEALLEQIALSGIGQGSEVLLALAVGGSPAKTALQRAGLVTVPRRINPKPFVMTTHDLGRGRDLRTIARHWQFTWGDMDVV